MASNGKIKAILPGGSAADSFNFVWTKNGSSIIGETKDSILNLDPANYGLTISLKSDSSCNGNYSGPLFAKIDTLTSNVFTSEVKCNGFSADSLWAIVTNTKGSGNYKYNWSPGSAADTFYKVLNKSAGLYNLIIVDRVTGCIGQNTYNITEPTPLTINLDKKINVRCKGESNGEIKVLGAGGNGGYIYQWSGINPLNGPIPNFNELVSLYADSLCVTVTDIKNCTVSACYTVTEPSKALVIDSIISINATTVGGSDGSATAYISGGTPIFLYRWQRQNGTTIIPIDNISATNNTKFNLSKQMYYVTVTDSKGCTTNDSVMVRDIICNMKGTFKTDSILCNGDSSGAIYFAAIDSLNYSSTNWYRYTLFNVNASPPIQIGAFQDKLNSWATDTASFTALKQGLYTVNVKTNKGCDTNFEFIYVEENPRYILSETINLMPSCFGDNDGEIHISAIGNTGPFQFNFGSGFQNDSFNKSRVSGINNVQVRNRFLCQDMLNYTIPTPDVISVFVPPLQTRCKGDTIKNPERIQVSSSNPNLLFGLGFMNKPGKDIDTASNFLRGLTAGIKNIIINYSNLANGKRCSFPYQFTVTEPDTLILSLDEAQDPSCSYNFDGRIDVSLNIGQRGNEPIGLQTYNYSLIKNSNLLSSQDDAFSSFTFSGLDSGIYTLSVIDPEQCMHSFNHTLLKPDTFKVGFAIPRDANCIEVSNGSITANSHIGGNGPGPLGYIYKWVMTDLLNGSVDTMASQVSATASFLRGLAEYRVIVSDRKGCTATRSTIIDTMYQLRITKVTEDSVDCFGSANGSIKVDEIHPSIAPQPYSYAFSGGNVQDSVARDLTAGTYTYTVTDGSGCKATGVSTIYEPSKIVILGKIRNTTCNITNGPADGSVKITISGGTPGYKKPVWNSAPNQQFTDSAVGLVAGNHTVVVTDSKGCPQPATFTILQPEPLIASVDRVKHITCFAADDGELDIKVIGGFPNLNYSWSHGLDNTLKQKNLKPGINNSLYRVTITDANNCTTSVSQEVREPKKLVIDPRPDSVTCPKFKDGVINITANGGTTTELNGFEYSIDGGTTYFSSDKFTGLAGKDYSVVVRDNNGCIATRKITVGEPEELFVTAKKDSVGPDTLTMGNRVELYYTLQTLSGTYPRITGINWTPSLALTCSDCARPKATPYVTTLYEVELTYHKSCKSTSKINVPVYDPLDFFIPSAFSPGNGDGLNDRLYLYGNGVKKMSLIIFNRWGEKVFESDHETIGWDGIYKNEPQPSGVYSFSAEVEYLNGEKRTKKGSITLVR